MKIVSPYTYLRVFNEKSAKKFTAVTWTVSTSIGLLPVMDWNTNRGANYCGYFGVLDKSYLSVFLFILLIAFLILIVMYIHILIIASSKFSQIQSWQWKIVLTTVTQTQKL